MRDARVPGCDEGDSADSAVIGRVVRRTGLNLAEIAVQVERDDDGAAALALASGGVRRGPRLAACLGSWQSGVGPIDRGVGRIDGPQRARIARAGGDCFDEIIVA